MTQWSKEWLDQLDAGAAEFEKQQKAERKALVAERKAAAVKAKQQDRRRQVLPYVVMAYMVVAACVAQLVVSGDYWQAGLSCLLVVVFSHYANKKQA